MADQTPVDNWSAQAYQTSASFVPKLTSKVLTLLSPQRGEKILDIGCGDGLLTAQIARIVADAIPNSSNTHEKGYIHGLDASQSMIESACTTHAGPMYDNLSFSVYDCSSLTPYATAHPSRYDAVFSNAAMHWILASHASDAGSMRRGFFAAVRDCLQPGGRLVFEMGGAGNVAEVHCALIAALVAVGGLRVEEARACNPWFFPGERWMKDLLEEVGFSDVKLETEFRPTQLTDHQGGGLPGWVRLMGAPFLEKVSDSKKDEAVEFVCEVLQDIVTREEDGSQWLGYVRLRGIAFRPEA